MTIDELVAVLDKALATLATHRETLRDLDAAVGDGDLGITVDKGSVAVRQALAEAPPENLGGLLRAAGAAFAKANPSTMAALVGAGLLAAAKEVGDRKECDSDVALQIGRAAMGRIAERGKAEIGDKTILDAMSPSLDALQEHPGDGLTAMIAAAQVGVDETRNQAGRRGRAAWVGERGSGHPDPGASAYVLFLTSLQDAMR